MRQLTKKEKIIMEQFWTYGPMFVRELQEHYEEPRPNFNTLSNQVHTLMEDGFLERKAYGSNYQYSAAVSRKAYSLDGFHGLVNEYFDSSYSSVVLGLVEDSVCQLKTSNVLLTKLKRENEHSSPFIPWKGGIANLCFRTYVPPFVASRNIPRP